MPGSTATDTGRVQVIGRHVILAEPPPPPSSSPVPEIIHLTPWDLRLITIDYIQKGVLLPKPRHEDRRAAVDRLASAFGRALGRFYPFAGRLVVHEHAGDGTITVSLRNCVAPARAPSSCTPWRRGSPPRTSSPRSTRRP